MAGLSRKLAAWAQALVDPARGLPGRYAAFKALLAADERCLLAIAELEEIFSGARQVDPARTRWLCAGLLEAVGEMTGSLEAMRPGAHPGLGPALERLRAALAPHLAPASAPASAQSPVPGPLVFPLEAALGRPDLAGGKAANLAAARKAGLSVPPGLVIGTGAFRLLLDSGNLRPRLDRLLRQVDLARPERIGPLCAGMRALVLGTPLPGELARAIGQAAQDLSSRVAAPGGGLLAARSSAVAEDGEQSFAGQYLSELNLPPEGVAEAYRRIVASKYRPRAVTYRVRQGLADEAAPMAVLLLPMVPAVAAGVLHTSEEGPAPGGGAGGKALTVYALPGLGEALVSGRAEPRVLRLARQLPPRVLSDSGPPDSPDFPDSSGGHGAEPGPRALAGLVLAGLVLESALGGPQEVEWALDGQGRVFVLQSRALPPPPAPPAQEAGEARESILPDARPLAEGLAPVAPGLGCGPVFHLPPGADPARVPAGCVLVVESLSPALARVVDRVAAVAARTGSRASHFGSIAREAGLPALSGLENPFAALPQGLLVTVDADARRILAGCADSPAGQRPPRGEAERLRRAERFAGLARLTCRLTLTDPEAPEFTPEGCASLHDLVRFCHEKAVAVMAGLSDGSARLGRARRLAAPLPLALYLLDLGGGLDPAAGAAPAPEHFASVPMRALWSGLAHPAEAWDKGFGCDWEHFDRISAGIFRKDSRALGSLALLARDYLHLLVRFGYHFAVLDSLCGPRAEANYVRLRFKGGGGLPEQRRLRLVFLSAVLEDLGFAVRLRGDMFDACLARRDEAATTGALALLGRLLVRSQRLDLGLASEPQALALARDFLAQCRTSADPDSTPGRLP